MGRGCSAQKSTAAGTVKRHLLQQVRLIEKIVRENLELFSSPQSPERKGFFWLLEVEMTNDYRQNSSISVYFIII
jgi:hypothetical protein